MKVFLSWSGEVSKGLADSLHSWLPRVIQAVRPYFSAEDVAKGARWSPEIARELEEARLGILIVTKESIEAPWLIFEAGALSKSLSRAKVVPLLFGLEPTEVRGPLVQFQAAKFEKAEMKRVLRMINSELGDVALPHDVLDASFEVWWPHLFADVSAKLARGAREGLPARRSERELLEELLILARRTAEFTARTAAKRRKRVGPRESVRKHSGSLSAGEVLTRRARGDDLSGSNLLGAALESLDLTSAELRGSNLVRANLAGANLTGADLTAANLEAAALDGCDLRGVNLSRTNLWRASMADVRNLRLAKSVKEANFFEVTGLSPDDRAFLAQQNVLSLGDYPSFFKYYRDRGMTREQMADLFLWTSMSGYPDVGYLL